MTNPKVFVCLGFKKNSFLICCFLRQIKWFSILDFSRVIHRFFGSPWYNHTGWLGVKHQLTHRFWMFFVHMLFHACTCVRIHRHLLMYTSLCRYSCMHTHTRVHACKHTMKRMHIHVYVHSLLLCVHLDMTALVDGAYNPKLLSYSLHSPFSCRNQQNKCACESKK